MNIKTPVCYDLSHWRPIPNFAALNPFPFLVLTKATEHTSYVDDTFVSHMAGMKQHGIYRGCYHFHRKAYGAITQAQHFCNTIQSHINNNDILVLDVEEGGELASQLIDFLKYVEGRFPNNLLMIYSRKNILDPIPMTNAQKEYLRTISIWTAGYPFLPDLYSTPPSSYIPDQSKWGVCLLWQYSEGGQVAGSSLPLDCNWVSPVLVAMLGEPPTQPPADITTYPYDGVTHISGKRYGWDFHLFITDPAKVIYESVYTPNLETVSSVSQRKRAQIAMNGGEELKINGAIVGMKDYTVSGGVVVHPRVQPVPSWMVDGENNIFINHYNAANVKQAFSGNRYLIENGTIKRYLYDPTDPLYEHATATEGHARHIEGETAAGYGMHFVSQGVYPNQGLTLFQAAEIMKSKGAVKAADYGGGGSVSCKIGEESLIVPEDIDPNTGQHVERRLPNSFMIYAITGGSMSDYYEYTATGNRAIRINWGVNSGRIPSYSDFLVNKKAKGGALAEDRHTITLAELSSTGGAVGDVWVRLYDNDGHAVNGWTAKTHLGQAQLTERLVVTEPPPPSTGNIHLDATLHSDGTVTGSWTDI